MAFLVRDSFRGRDLQGKTCTPSCGPVSDCETAILEVPQWKIVQNPSPLQPFCINTTNTTFGGPSIDSVLAIRRSELDGGARLGFMYWDTVWPDDQASRATIQNVTGFGTGLTALAVRIDPCPDPDRASCYALGVTAGSISLFRVGDGTKSAPLGVHNATIQLADLIELKAIGTTISVLLNDVTVISVTDSVIASGKCGWVQAEPSTGLSMDMQWFDWEGEAFNETSSGNQFCEEAPLLTAGRHNWPTYMGPNLKRFGLHTLPR